MSKAIVTLVMNGNSYVPGAVAMAVSVKKTGWIHDIVCMITEDVTDTSELKKNFSRVVRVPKLVYQVKNLPSARQRELYSSWQDASFTKWNCLKLKYSLVLFIDADIIITKNPEELFSYQAPAAWFGSVWARKSKNIFCAFNEIQTGEEISNELIQKAVHGKFEKKTQLLWGSFVLLAPSKSIYQKFLDYMDRVEKPFGFNNLSMFDEQSILMFLCQENKKWTMLSSAWQVVPWHREVMSDKGNIFGWHYFGDVKPWKKESEKWEDTKLWRDMYSERIQ